MGWGPPDDACSCEDHPGPRAAPGAGSWGGQGPPGSDAGRGALPGLLRGTDPSHPVLRGQSPSQGWGCRTSLALAGSGRMRCFLQGPLLLSILLRTAGEPPTSTCDHRLSRTHGHPSQGVRQGSSRPKALRLGLVTREQREWGSGVPGQEVLGGARGTLPHDVGEQVGAPAISLGGGCDGRRRRPGEGAGSFEEKCQRPGGLGWRVLRGPWCDWR